MHGAKDFAFEFWGGLFGSLGLGDALIAKRNCADHPLMWVIDTASNYGPYPGCDL